jgi:hypothetical protein
MPMLQLLGEALALLEPKVRWMVTFNTYFTALPAGLTCAWRCCVPDAYCLREARHARRARIIDLTRPETLESENPLVDCARKGTPRPDSLHDGNERAFVTMQNRNRKSLRMTPRRRDSQPGGNADDA